MNAKITQQGGYLCAPLGHTVMHFHEGQIVSGIVAELALADGAAVAVNMMRAADLERNRFTTTGTHRGASAPGVPLVHGSAFSRLGAPSIPRAIQNSDFIDTGD